MTKAGRVPAYRVERKYRIMTMLSSCIPSRCLPRDNGRLDKSIDKSASWKGGANGLTNVTSARTYYTLVSRKLDHYESILTRADCSSGPLLLNTDTVFSRVMCLYIFKSYLSVQEIFSSFEKSLKLIYLFLWHTKVHL